MRCGLWLQLWVRTPAPQLSSSVTLEMITHSLGHDEDQMRDPKQSTEFLI